MIDNRAAVSASVEGCQRIFSGPSECRGLVGDKLAADVAKGEEIGCIASGDRGELAPAFGQID